MFGEKLLVGQWNMNDIQVQIAQQIASNPIIIYMKGSPQFPQCGFSARAVQALLACKEPFAYINVLENPEIRAQLPEYAQWPTFPQLWVNGELIGGCDIVVEMFEAGELLPLLQNAVTKPVNDQLLS